MSTNLFSKIDIIKKKDLIIMTFYENLKYQRQILQISQKELAKMLNTTHKTISHWETGYTEPSIAQLISLADIFECSIDDLVCRKTR